MSEQQNLFPSICSITHYCIKISFFYNISSPNWELYFTKVTVKAHGPLVNFKIRTDWSKWIDNEYLLISSQFWIKLYIYLLQITVKWWKPASVVYDLNRLYIYLLQIAVQWGGLAHTPVSLPGLRQTVLVWWLLFWAVCSGYNLLLTEDPVPHRFSCRFAREDRCTHSLVFVLPPMPA